MRLRIGVDVGGSHTDVVLLNEDTGKVFEWKVPSTPGDLAEGVLQGIREALAHADLSLDSVVRFVYGTTFVVNALVQRTDLSKVALLTTKGFRDVLEIGKAARRGNVYDIHARPLEPLVPRNLRFGITERISASGDVVEPLDEREVESVLEECRRNQVTGIAVCFFHSYVNPAHERRVKEICHEKYPDLKVTLSSEVNPEFREYERASTTVINALAGPPLSQHLTHLGSRLRDLGYNGGTYIMQANGGVGTFRSAQSRPAQAIESGPVAGVIGGGWIASLLGHRDVITFDMGGTTSDVGIIVDGTPRWKALSQVYGHPVRVPSIEVTSIGAGGGSIAWVDEGGALKVGPRSAGAVPGPACYGRGGEEPTLTDAHLILGHLKPDWFLGGHGRLYPEKARNAFLPMAQALGMDLIEAAVGVIKIAESNMVNALKLLTLSRGYDLKDFTLVAFGGAGPLYASRLAQQLGVRKVVLPRKPGVTSALGLLVANIQHDYVWSRIGRVDQLDAAEIAEAFSRLEADGWQELIDEGVPEDKRVLVRSVDMRYLGQGYELNVPVPHGDVDLKELSARFHDLHAQTYGFATEQQPLELVNVRVTAIGLLEAPRWALEPVRETKPEDALIGRWPIHLPTDQATGVAGSHSVEVTADFYDGDRLRGGHVIEGPALILERTSSALILPGQRARMDSLGNLHLEFEGSSLGEGA